MSSGVSGTKGSRTVQPAPPPQPAPRQIPKGPVSNNFEAFAQLTPDEQANAINAAISSNVPDHLNSDSDLQKLLYSQRIIGMPDVVSDSQLDKMQGTELFRTVNSIYDSKNDVGYSAPEIATQVMKARQTYVSHGSNAVHGEGIYFADDRRDSEGYGRTSGDLAKTAVIRAKIKPGTKTISSSMAQTKANQEIRAGTELGKALKKSSDPRALYAAAKGYQALTSPWGYYSVIDRSCLVISDKITPKR